MRCPVCDQKYGHAPGCPEDKPLWKTYTVTYREIILKECTVYVEDEGDVVENFNNGLIYNDTFIEEVDQIESIERTN